MGGVVGKEGGLHERVAVTGSLPIQMPQRLCVAGQKIRRRVVALAPRLVERSLVLTQSPQVHERLSAIGLGRAVAVTARPSVGDGVLTSRMRPSGVENAFPAVPRASPSPQTQCVLKEFPRIHLGS